MTLFPATAMATELEVFHADSLAGPMREIKVAFEAKNAGVNLSLTSGRVAGAWPRESSRATFATSSRPRRPR